MTDKERILMTIVSRFIPALMFRDEKKKNEYYKPYMLGTSDLKPGDLVVANTTLEPNDFMVGFVHEVKSDCVMIREIGSKKLCDYYNETFSILNKEKLGYEILEGVQYKTYQKVLKAFSEYTKTPTLFRSIEFSDDICTVTSRKKFTNDKNGEISFKYHAKTKISDIGKLLQEQGL